MANPYLSEIRLTSFSFAQNHWALCNGQLLPINQNQALFSLLGTTFGGDGRVNFALPDLRGRIPMGVGNGHVLGEKGGEQAHNLTISEMPTHNHVVNGGSGTPVSPTRTATGTAYLASTLRNADPIYSTGSMVAVLGANTVGTQGGSQAHLNMQPFLTLSYMIALTGIFPSEN